MQAGLEKSGTQGVVRPVTARDLPQLIALAESLGSGMTTMPRDADTLAQKVERSEQSFAGRATEDLQYLLVLDNGDGQIAGISAVYPRIGDTHGFFSYKRTKLVQRSALLDRRTEIELLTLNNDYTGATEVGSLAVSPTQRGGGAGRLLARARYMLIAAFPDLFAPIVMAEMRGWQDERGHSPFWDAIGDHFFHMPFEEADRLSAEQGVGFIAEMMPKHPIYTAMLPEAARTAIGKPHRDSAKAKEMLEAEDFKFDGYVDVFDGGPQVQAARDKIRTVVENKLGRVSGKGVSAPERPLLLSNNDLQNFRVLSFTGAAQDDVALLPDAVRRALQLGDGDAVRIAPGTKAKVTA